MAAIPKAPLCGPAGAVEGRVVGTSPLSIWAVPSAERLRRQLAKAGAVAASSTADRVVLLRADRVFDDPLVRGLVETGRDVALVGDDGAVAAVAVGADAAEAAGAGLLEGRAADGVERRSPLQLVGSYNQKLRKREPPYLMALGEAELPAIERRVFGGSYKGVTDLVTLWLWPRPARAATRWCAARGLTPNQVTTASFVLVLAAMALFWRGHYGWGLAAAWAMTFLDTVDGKLARVTVQSSRFGDRFDHLTDLVHPPFWWWAWIVGLPAVRLPLAGADLVLAVIVGGYVLQRLEEALFQVWFGMDMHTWQRFDSRFRLVTARRNPNLVILTLATLVGRPDVGIVAVAAWTAVSLMVHAVRLLQAGAARRRGPLCSWLAAT